MFSMRSLVVSVAALGVTSSLGLAATSWSIPAGSSDTITYMNGQTQNGLFTPDSPTVVSNTFIFDPANFSATSNGDASLAITNAAPSNDASVASDIASVIVTAQPGQSLSHISADLGGDFSTLGLAATDAVGTLTVTNPMTHQVFSKPFDFGTQFSSGAATFEDAETIDLPAGWKSAELDLSTTLTASAEPGSTSFIQLKSAELGVQTVKAAAVPLPPAAVAAIPAIVIAGFAIRRKRFA